MIQPKQYQPSITKCNNDSKRGKYVNNLIEKSCKAFDKECKNDRNKSL